MEVPGTKPQNGLLKLITSAWLFLKFNMKDGALCNMELNRVSDMRHGRSGGGGGSLQNRRGGGSSLTLQIGEGAGNM